MVRIFIPTWNRAKTIRSHKVFEGADYTVVVHNVDQLEQYHENPTVDKDRIVISNVEPGSHGLTRQREWIMDNLVGYDEWILFADDNIRKLESVPEPLYSQDTIEFPKKYSGDWRKTYATPCSVPRLMEIINDMIYRADTMGAALAGFASVDNYYFRAVHWHTVKFVIGKMFLQHSRWDFKYDHSISMEDYYLTARHFLEIGPILRNNYTRPHALHYVVGGMGRYEERAKYREADCTRLMEMFPGLYRRRKRSKRADLDLKIRNEGDLAKWQMNMRSPIEKILRTPLS